MDHELLTYILIMDSYGLVWERLTVYLPRDYSPIFFARALTDLMLEMKVNNTGSIFHIIMSITKT